MNDDLQLLLMLSAFFFVIALLYSSVGFGGGSSYTALLALFGLPALAIPVLSLSCNLIVAGGGSWIFFRQKHLRPSLIVPFVLPAIPAAYLGGRIPLNPELYFPLLAASLAAASLVLFLRPSGTDDATRPCSPLTSTVVGIFLGLLSGMVGIGGGIFLAPLLLLRRWAAPREAAACAAVFILLNSIAGLAGQLAKSGSTEALASLPLLALAVLAGGQLGSRLGAKTLPPRWIRQGTAVLILLVSLRLFLQAFTR